MEKKIKDKYSVNPTDIVARKCDYNPKTDIEKVIDGQSINLVDALRNGVINSIEMPDTENGLTSPDDIRGRLQDEFDAARALQNSRMREEEHKSNKAKKAVAAAAAAAAAVPPSA